MRHWPIGIFDSGIGGLTVFKAISALLPHERLVYVADSAYCPYGHRSEQEILERSLYIAHWLREYPCKLIVVACNTATAAAIGQLRQAIVLPFVGMEPAIKQAASLTKSGKVGVLATANTLKSEKYRKTAGQFAAHVQVWVQPGHGLVEIVEGKLQKAPETNGRLRELLGPMLEAGIDQLVLGCTHYPFLMEQIQSICGPSVHVIDPSPAVAKQVERLLSPDLLAEPGVADPKHEFIITGHDTDLLSDQVGWLGDNPPQFLSKKS